MPTLIRYIYLNLLIDKGENNQFYNYIFEKVIPSDFDGYTWTVAEKFWTKYKIVSYQKPRQMNVK